MLASLAWIAVAPVHAHALALIGRPLMSLLERDPATRYEVAGNRLMAHRRVWLPRQQTLAPVTQPLWVGAQHFGLPLLAALIVSTPGWSWRKRGRALVWGLGLLTVTQIAQFLVTVEATQQSAIMSAEGPVYLTPPSPIAQPFFYGLYYFFELMGRGFFALLIYAGLIAFLGDRQAARATSVRRNAPCPCGSGKKFKHCHGAGAGGR